MRVALVWLISLAGCAELSGLGSLEVGDATSVVDATSEDAGTTTDANGGPDVSDASDAVVTPDSIVGGNCKSPADCKNTEVCCETFDTSGLGQPPNCTIDADTIGCSSPTACPTSVSFTCAEKDVFRRCAVTSDCTESAYPKCCTGKIGATGTRTICLSNVLAAAIDASCQ